MTTYPAQAYAADGRGGARDCRLSLGPSGLSGETGDGLSFQWAYRDLRLHHTGEDGGFLRLKSAAPGAFDGSLITRDDAFREALAARLGEPHRSFLLNFKKQHRGILAAKWRNLALAALGAAALFLGGYWALGHWAADFAAKHLPIPVETAWGEVQARSEMAQGQVVEGGPAVAAVQTIVDRLAAAVPDNPGYHFQVHVLESPEVNAFALPGGQIFVLTGLLGEAKDPEEVAGVLAHEMQHVLHRHVVRRTVEELGFRLWVALLFGHTGLAVLAQQAGKVMDLSFSRSQESQADLDGARLLARADLPVAPLEDFFTRLAEQQGLMGAKAVALLEDHPASLDRVAALRALAQKIEPKHPRDFPGIDWKAVQASLKN
ncbi:MAG TPA: M48 family metallopeptidase [bacterium]|nr:M48 family metallopeptidase [bacterium]